VSDEIIPLDESQCNKMISEGNVKFIGFVRVKNSLNEQWVPVDLNEMKKLSPTCKEYGHQPKRMNIIVVSSPTRTTIKRGFFFKCTVPLNLIYQCGNNWHPMVSVEHLERCKSLNFLQCIKTDVV
jgi:hypothetical protein